MGLHPPLISEDLFQKANEVLDGRKRNTDFLTYKTDLYPLKGFLMCPTHKTALTAYGSTGRNKKIHHYYICVKCQKKQRHRIGDVHKSMEDALSNISITAQSVQLYKKILEKIFDKEDINRKSDIENLKNETTRLNNRRGNLQERLMDNDITPQDYKEMKQKIESDLNVCQSKLNNLNLGMTPYKNYITKEIPMLENLVTYYNKVDGRTKRKILGCNFLEKLVLENGRVATKPHSQGVLLLF